MNVIFRLDKSFEYSEPSLLASDMEVVLDIPGEGENLKFIFSYVLSYRFQSSYICVNPIDAYLELAVIENSDMIQHYYGENVARMGVDVWKPQHFAIYFPEQKGQYEIIARSVTIQKAGIPILQYPKHNASQSLEE